MRIIFFLTILLFVFTTAQARIIPTNLTSNQREKILPYYSNSFPQQTSTRPYFLGDYPGIEFGLSFSYRGLSDIQRDFSTDSIQDEIILSQLFIKKALVHRFDLTITSTISSFGTTQASGFGGTLTWNPISISDFSLIPAMALFTNYLNLEDTLTYQESGLQLLVGKNFKQFSIKAGASFSRLSSRFTGTVNGSTITDSGRTERADIWIKNYFASLQFEWNKYSLTATQNYTMNAGWNPNLILSYCF